MESDILVEITQPIKATIRRKHDFSPIELFPKRVRQAESPSSQLINSASNNLDVSYAGSEPQEIAEFKKSATELLSKPNQCHAMTKINQPMQGTHEIVMLYILRINLQFATTRSL